MKFKLTNQKGESFETNYSVRYMGMFFNAYNYIDMQVGDVWVFKTFAGELTVERTE